MKHNKTYKKQNTKYQKERAARLTIISGIFAAVMLLAFYSCISSIYIKSQNLAKSMQNNGQSMQISDLTIINLTSNNPHYEQIAYLAAFQACDALLPGNASCVNDMIAIAKTENTNFCYNCAGQDSYQSSGLYQISLFYHKNLTLAQINDPYFAANWTLRNLIANGYPSNRSYSIQKHNGTPNINATRLYLSKVNNYISNTLNK